MVVSFGVSSLRRTAAVGFGANCARRKEGLTIDEVAARLPPGTCSEKSRVNWLSERCRLIDLIDKYPLFIFAKNVSQSRRLYKLQDVFEEDADLRQRCQAGRPKELSMKWLLSGVE